MSLPLLKKVNQANLLNKAKLRDKKFRQDTTTKERIGDKRHWTLIQHNYLLLL